MPTLEQINETRARLGQEPLAESPNADKVENKVVDTTTTNTTNDNKQTPPVETKVEAIVPKEEKKVAEVKVEPKNEAISEEAVLAYLKNKGMEISSLDQLAPKKETAEQIQEKRDNAKLAYAFQKGLITQKQFQAFSADSADLQNLVYRQYLQDQKKEDADLTDLEIMEEFQAKFGLSENSTERQRKRGQKEISVLGHQILKDSYKEVFSIEDSFSKYEAEENTRTSEERKLIEETPKYKSHIDNIFGNDLTKFSVKLGEDNYDLEVPADLLAQTKSELLKTETAITNIKNGYDNNTLTEIATMMVLKSSFPTLLQNAFEKGKIKAQAGVKGIVVTPTHIQPSELTEKQRERREKLGITQSAN